MKYFNIFSECASILAPASEQRDRLDSYRQWKRTLPKNFDETFDLKESAEMFIREKLPGENQVCVLDVVPQADPLTIDRWLKAEKIPFARTIAGIYIDNSAITTVIERQSFLPLFPLFEESCKNYEFGNVSQQDYYLFLRCVPTALIHSSLYHPSFPRTREFYCTENKETLEAEIYRWCLLKNASTPSPITGYVSISDAADRLSVKPDTLLNWLETNVIQRRYISKSHIVVSETVVTELENMAAHALPLADLIRDAITAHNMSKRTEAKKYILDHLTPSPPWLIKENDFPGAKPFAHYNSRFSSDALKFLDDLLYKYPTLSLKELASASQLTGVQLENLVAAGVIDAEVDDKGRYCISQYTYDQCLLTVQQHLSLDDIVLNLQIETGTKFSINRPTERAELIKYLWRIDKNVYKQLCWAEKKPMLPMNYKLFGCIVPTNCVDQVIAHLTLWLKLFGHTYHRKSEIILAEMAQKGFPSAVMASRHYLGLGEYDKSDYDMLSALYEGLVAAGMDLLQLRGDEARIEKYLYSRCKYLTITCAEKFAGFLIAEGVTDRQYEVERTGVKREYKAYLPEDFAVMSDVVINRKTWDELNLIEKAINDPVCAELWLNVAFHLCASWRYSDFCRLPAPEMPTKYTASSILDCISNGTFPDVDARQIAINYRHSVTYKRMTAKKTTDGKNIVEAVDLYFYIPSDLEVQVGTILAISWAHYINLNKTQFFEPTSNRSVIRKFFGQKFANACGGKDFNGIRACKALMQATVQMNSSTTSNSKLSYFLSSLMRGHISSRGVLSATTGIYLTGSEYDELSPDFVLEQMMQRDAMSFVADALLKKEFGEQYTSLPTPLKTKAIQELNLSPRKINETLKIISAAEERAIAVVRDVMNLPGARSAGEMLKSISTGQAYGKGKDFCCLCRAAGVACQDPDRVCCLGCRYEARTKAVFLLYLDNYANLLKTTNESADEGLREKAAWLIDEHVQPAIKELLVLIKATAPEDEFEAYRRIYEERMINGVGDPAS